MLLIYESRMVQKYTCFARIVSNCSVDGRMISLVRFLSLCTKAKLVVSHINLGLPVSQSQYCGGFCYILSFQVLSIRFQEVCVILLMLLLILGEIFYSIIAVT